jgi:hypothetical protein
MAVGQLSVDVTHRAWLQLLQHGCSVTPAPLLLHRCSATASACTGAASAKVTHLLMPPPLPYLYRCRCGWCSCRWGGADCGTLQRQPSQPGGLYNFEEPGSGRYSANGTSRTASWGGNMLPSASGEGYDLFVAEIPDGLINWGSHGLCVHATSPNRSGPFVRRGVALGPECHNPQVLRDRATGDYLLFHYGKTIGQARAWLAHSPTADGAFSLLNTSAVPTCNNPAPAYHPNGTLFVLCDYMYLTHLGSGKRAWERGEWSAPGAAVIDPISPHDPARHFEDPHLWFDRRGNWHVIYHVYCLLPFSAHHECFSAHAFSTDGREWTVSSTEPFDGGVHYTDGTSTIFSTRE